MDGAAHSRTRGGARGEHYEYGEQEGKYRVVGGVVEVEFGSDEEEDVEDECFCDGFMEGYDVGFAAGFLKGVEKGNFKQEDGYVKDGDFETSEYGGPEKEKNHEKGEYGGLAKDGDFEKNEYGGPEKDRNHEKGEYGGLEKEGDFEKGENGGLEKDEGFVKGEYGGPEKDAGAEVEADERGDFEDDQRDGNEDDQKDERGDCEDGGCRGFEESFGELNEGDFGTDEEDGEEDDAEGADDGEGGFEDYFNDWLGAARGVSRWLVGLVSVGVEAAVKAFEVGAQAVQRVWGILYGRTGVERRTAEAVGGGRKTRRRRRAAQRTGEQVPLAAGPVKVREAGTGQAEGVEVQPEAVRSGGEEEVSWSGGRRRRRGRRACAEAF